MTEYYQKVLLTRPMYKRYNSLLKGSISIILKLDINLSSGFEKRHIHVVSCLNKTKTLKTKIKLYHLLISSTNNLFVRVSSLNVFCFCFCFRVILSLSISVQVTILEERRMICSLRHIYYFVYLDMSGL